MFAATPNPARSAVVEEITRRASRPGAPGRKTYRLAEITLRWWSGDRAAALRLLEDLANETPSDPQLSSALQVARASVKNNTK
jgi:hypothetical protein